VLYNLGILHANVNNDPAAADGTGAQAFTASDGNDYDLTDARPTAAAANGLQAFVELETTARNPLSADGLGT
jgi:hypothetical protein